MSDPGSYRVEILPSALRELDRLPPSVQGRIRQRIRNLGAQPRPSGAKSLVGIADALRIRVGDYRIIYRVDDAERRVIVEQVGHRREVYR